MNISSRTISFMKYRWLYFAISLLVIIPGLVSLATHGLKLSLDFTGGSLLEVQYPASQAELFKSREQLQEALGESYELSSLQASGEHQAILRGKEINNEQKNQVIVKLMNATFEPVNELRFETVGPTLGKELIQKTLVAIAIVAVGITLFVWHQFHNPKYGISAILAMFHDTLVLLGSFSLLGWLMGIEVDVLFVTALLTTLSFSVHDTIVVYDRIREMSRKHPRTPYVELVDAAVLETLGRSLNNSMTIIIMLLALVLLGGDTIRWFGVALLIGAITGTYSSTFTAAPLLLLWDDVQRWRQKKTQK